MKMGFGLFKKIDYLFYFSVPVKCQSVSTCVGGKFQMSLLLPLQLPLTMLSRLIKFQMIACSGLF